MEEIVDYKAMAEGLMTELEDARRSIADLHFAKNLVSGFRMNGDAIRQFVQKNYLVILVAVFLLSFILSALKTIKGLFDSEG